MMSLLTTQHATLERSRKNYEKAFKEAERAVDNYQRADADLNLSRAEVEKQKMNMTIKSQQCEDAKNEYANQLQRTNEQQVVKGFSWASVFFLVFTCLSFWVMSRCSLHPYYNEHHP
jgi:hypothetical protein